MRRPSLPGVSTPAPTISRVDPTGPELDAWWEVYAAAEREGRGDLAPLWLVHELRAELVGGDASSDRSAWVARDADGTVVAAGHLELPLLDNTSTAMVATYVHPRAARRGHGTAVLRHLEKRAVAAGRTVLTAEASWAYDLPGGRLGDGTLVGPLAFAARHGYALALEDVMRELALPVDTGLLDALAEQAAPHHAAYTLRTFAGPVPEELVTGWAALVATLGTEAPQGDLELEDEVVDPALVREREAVLAAQGRTRYACVALDATGEVVAFSDLAAGEPPTERAYQWGTLVRPDHRGHRLGLACKVANLRQTLALRPDLRRLTTYNAEVNAPMIGVNAQLGFRPVERLGELQKKLPR